MSKASFTHKEATPLSDLFAKKKKASELAEATPAACANGFF
jgi:hypothetical protein